MDTDVPPSTGPTDSGRSELGDRFAALVGDNGWQLDAPEQPLPESPGTAVADSHPEPSPAGTAKAYVGRPSPVDDVSPPTPEQIIEALLFAGGPPLSPERVCEVIRGLTTEQFRVSVETLNGRYRVQSRPYVIACGEKGYALTVKGHFRGVREKLFGGPREARLTQPALDVLALVAYRQPVSRAEVDAVRGADSAALLRQLVRLALVAVTQRGDAGQQEVCYGTTPRFLEVFGLRTLDDLPRTGDPQRL